MPVKVSEPDEQHPYQVWRGDVAWVAKDPETSVASQGDTPEDAVKNLREALELRQEVLEEETDAPTPNAPWL